MPSVYLYVKDSGRPSSSVTTTVGTNDGNSLYVSGSYNAIDLYTGSGTKILYIRPQYEVKCNFNKSTKKWTCSAYIGFNRSVKIDSTISFYYDDPNTGRAIKTIPSDTPVEIWNIGTTANTRKLYDVGSYVVEDGGSKTLKKTSLVLYKYDNGLTPIEIEIPELTFKFNKRIGHLTVTFDKKDFSSSPTNIDEDLAYDSTKSVNFASLYKSNAKEDIKYKLTFKDDKASVVSTWDSKPGKISVPWGNYKWVSSNGSYNAGTSANLPPGTYNFEAASSKNYLEATVTTNSIIGKLPDKLSVFGYNEGKWVNNSGEQISISTIVEKDETYIKERQGIQYKVSFNLDSTAAKWGESGPIGTLYRTYGEDIKEPISGFSADNPTKFGYEFVGWHTNKTINWDNENILKSTDFLKDVDTKFVNPELRDKGLTLTSSTTIKLYSIWRPVNHIIRCNYFVKDELKSFDVVYTIEGDTRASFNKIPVSIYSPDASLGEDWAFLGWKDLDNSQSSLIEKWRLSNGIYPNPTTKFDDKVELINYVDLPWSFNPKEIKEWVEGTVTHELYGFWTITGKRIKLRDVWRKINVAYIKLNNKWIPLVGNDETSFSVKINDEWKKEVNFERSV